MGLCREIRSREGSHVVVYVVADRDVFRGLVKDYIVTVMHGSRDVEHAFHVIEADPLLTPSDASVDFDWVSIDDCFDTEKEALAALRIRLDEAVAKRLKDAQELNERIDRRVVEAAHTETQDEAF